MTAKHLGVGLLTALALTGCKSLEAATAGGDVVVAISYSRAGDTHRAECASDPAARLGQYQVPVSAAVADELRAGDACPAGPREPLAKDQYPQLYDTLREGLYAPMPYEGGNAKTCGEWGTVDAAEARLLAQRCPPITRGNPY